MKSSLNRKRKASLIEEAAVFAVLASVAPVSPAVAWAVNVERPEAAQPFQSRAGFQDLSETSIASVSSEDGTLYFDSLAEAVGAAVDGDLVTLLKDVEVNQPITVAHNITLLLDGNTVTNRVSGERAFIVTGTGFTVDGTAEGSAMVIPEANTGSYGFVKVAAPAKVTLDGGEYTGDTDNGAFVKIVHNDSIDASGSTVVMSNVSMSSNNRFFSTDTLSTSADVITLEVKGGTFDTTGQAFGSDVLYPSKIYFTGAQVTAGGGPCIEVCGPDATFEDCIFNVTNDSNPSHFQATAVSTSYGGVATINGGSYKSTGYGAYVYSSGGQIVINDGFVSGGVGALQADVDSQTYPTATSKIAVYGGTTDGRWAANGEKATLTAAGGTHTSDTFSNYLVDGAAVRREGIGGSITYSVYGSEAEALASLGGGYSVEINGHTWIFDTREEAADAAGNAGDDEPDITLNHVVTFDDRGNQTKAIVADGSATMRPSDPVRAGYVFQGWFTSEGQLFEFSSPVTSDITLTARWRAVPVIVPKPTYSIAVSDTDNGTVKVSPERATAGTDMTIEATPDEGFEVSAVVVTDKDGKDVEVTASRDGTWSFEMPSGGATVTVEFACDGGELCPSRGLVDVIKGEWHHAPVDWAVSTGLMSGYDDGSDTFGPDDELTRAQLAQMLYNQADKPASDGDVSQFSDCSNGAWYAPAVSWAAGEGLLKGYDGQGTFGPDDVLTREQLAVVFWRIAGEPAADADLSAFPDGSETDSWARDAVEWAISTGLLQGYDDTGELDPTGDITRAQAATVFMREAKAE